MISDFAYVWSDNPYGKKEILLKNKNVAIPTDVPVGSIAYTADLSYIAQFDGENWVEIGATANNG